MHRGLRTSGHLSPRSVSVLAGKSTIARRVFAAF